MKKDSVKLNLQKLGLKALSKEQSLEVKGGDDGPVLEDMLIV